MKYRQPILFLLILLCQTGFGQQPGGVSQPIAWYKTQKLDNGQYGWVNVLNPNQAPLTAAFSHPPKTNRQLNHNPALYFAGSKSQIKIPILSKKNGIYDLFTLYQSDLEGRESNLWSLETPSSTRKVMTTHRVADLEQFQYMNYTFKKPGLPELNHYFQAGTLAPADQALQLSWGGLPHYPNLPIEAFQGIVPEWILYDRILSDQETLQVESYLAIKYGITLRRPIVSDYLDSQGQVIWTGKQNRAFHHQIAGIGRDDLSDLKQFQAASSTAPSVISMLFSEETNPQLLMPDQSFLIWGNNAQTLDWEETTLKDIGQLQRIWRVQLSGKAHLAPTTINFDPKAIFQGLEKDETYWLLLQNSGIEKLSAENANLYPLKQNEQVWSADSIIWGPSGQQLAHFTILKGPELMAFANIEEPLCQSGSGGNVFLKIAGGITPYQVNLSGDNGAVQNQIAEANNGLLRFSNLPPGEYFLSIKDRKGKIYQQNLQITNQDGPTIDLQDSYLLADNPLSLNALGNSSTEGHSIEWTGPNGFQSHDPQIHIQQPGQYTVKVEQSGCYSFHSFVVNASSDDLFDKVILSPNPVLAGKPFNLKVRLHDIQDLDLQILDLTGKTILQIKQTGQDQYSIEEALTTPGVYLVKITAKNASRTFRLIVQS